MLLFNRRVPRVCLMTVLARMVLFVGLGVFAIVGSDAKGANPDAPVGEEADVTPPDGRLPIPDQAAIAESQRMIRDLFKEDYSKSGSKNRVSLAEKLFKKSGDSSDDAASRFVLLREARDIAASAGDVQLAIRAADALAKDFRIEPLKGRMDALFLISADETNSADVARAYLEISKRASDKRDYDLAAKAVAKAEASARKSKNASVVSSVKQQATALEQNKKQQAAVDAAEKKLVDAPDDPEANQIAGQYHCFVLDDWAVGVQMLLKSRDPALVAIAGKEVANPTDAKALVALGDAWWDWWQKSIPAGGHGPPISLAYQGAAAKRALLLYQRVLPELTGLRKDAVSKRITTLKDATTTLPAVAREFDIPEGSPLCTVTDEGVTVDNGSIRTKAELPVPVKIQVVAKTSLRHLVVSYAKGNIILRWEQDHNRLVYADPKTGGTNVLGDGGMIPANEWVTITWIVENDKSTIYVDNEKRATIPGDYKSVKGTAGVGSAFDGVTTVKSITFVPLKPAKSK